MSTWSSVSDEFSYGIVIYNYKGEDDLKLELTVGETVHILQEEANWYYGYVTTNRNCKGIFPKNYVHIKQCITVDTKGPTPNFAFREPPITHEISSVLREWGYHWKNLYIQQSNKFEEIKNKIYDLLSQRSKILSGTLPVDELKRVTKQATEAIDEGNKTLGLDLVVRDKDGNIIDPDVTSTIQLYYHHKNATERMSSRSKVVVKDETPKTAIQQFSNVFLLSVRNFTFKLSEDAELLMMLYDAKEQRSFTENYVVRWNKEGLMSDLDQMYNLRVMFTDLGKKDLERERIFFVCQVIRVGAMEAKELELRRSSVSAMNAKNNKSYINNMRRPLGVAAMDITNYLSGKLESNLEKEFSVPFVSCEKDNLEQTLKKIINKNNSENRNQSQNQSLYVSWKLLRGDSKQVREENRHLVLGNVSTARKMGFPEVILPGDVRNDLYLTLLSGEFNKGNKSSDKNVEVTVKVCNKQGQPIPGVISVGGGIQNINEYRSVIYYHEDKPQWFETFKVAIPIEEFKTSHLKFTFKHRSSNEVKDKTEKPFAMCYVTLMQKNGTTLRDKRHDLVVYKIDHKKFDEDSLDYLELPSTLAEVKNQKASAGGLTVNLKDSFCIESNICSTKLTQNVDLLGLLNWSANKDSLEDSLKALMNVDGEEVVKFLQDILDALFNILMENQETDKYDTLVFECLLFIIGLVNNWKYQHFEPVLDLYIKESFSATLAYKKLIGVLKSIIDTRNLHTHAKDLMFRTMKCLQYVMRFISRSRILYRDLNPDVDDSFDEEFEELLQDIIIMMSITREDHHDLLREQGAVLKYFPSTIPDILMIYPPPRLSLVLCQILSGIPKGRLTKQKMMTINDIVHSKLFLISECRSILLPKFTEQIRDLFQTKEEGVATRQDGRRQNRSVAKVAQLLGTTAHCVNQHVGYSEEVDLCIKIMSDIMELLFRKNIGPTSDDLSEIIRTVLRTIIQSHIKMEKDNPHASMDSSACKATYVKGNLVAVMIDIFRQMTEEHYNEYINRFSTSFDILDFLMEILVVFKELVNNSIFPEDWSEMIMLQNSIILKSLRFFSHTIRDRFFDKFEYDAWSNFFHCAIAFMTQKALQLENFTSSKRLRLVNRYNDMRRETGFEIRQMWFNLGLHKIHFVPGLVELMLDMTLIPETELRKATIPIFFDMMQCEYYSSKLEFESYGDTKRDSTHIKASFAEFEKEMIHKLDTLFGLRGDAEYMNLFYDIMIELCEQHSSLAIEGIKFVKIVKKLMENLLEYRSIVSDENKENTMSCTVNLLDFYSEINKKEMYIKYLNKLYDLHIECDNYTEAAYTLMQHTILLDWSNDILSPLLVHSKYEKKTHRDLKEALYKDIIDNFDKGKMWECAISKCQELAKQCEEETFDYFKLRDLHQRMATFYDNIMKSVRPEPEYFRVGYFGQGFPKFLRNKIFIFRGKEYERLVDFSTRILNVFPKAELLKTLTPPGSDIQNSDRQYIQVNKVDPVMDEKKQRFSGKPVSDQIVKFYKVNNIQRYIYSRPFIKKDPNLNCNNEFSSLWLERTEIETTYPLPGILRWFPVKHSKVEEICPLRYAIETIERTNKDLTKFVNMYNMDKNMDVKPLSLKLNGILDPAVMGGIKNYEDAFFHSNYIDLYPENKILIMKLKDLIADQMPLLGLCVQIHKYIHTSEITALHTRFEECFKKMQEVVEREYGKKTCDLKLENEVQMRRHFSIAENRAMSEFPNSGDKQPHNSHSKTVIISPTKSLSGSSTYKKSKTPKEKRRSSKSDLGSPALVTGASQWYTEDTKSSTTTLSNGSPIIELTEELLPKRPLRAEVEKEKRLSRPPSGQFSRPNSMTVTIRGASSSGNSSNRDSVGTTDSSISEEDMIPPPLPLKSRDMDYSNLPPAENVSFLYSQRNSTARASIQIKWPEDNIVVDFDEVPPTPPPKPPKKQKF
ncbi:dedicator of cytokinesis protein 1 isoform X5 [Aethina tumida]|uniref:dedicator of cytokinesis protein 1 isoform X5 n=1 Tax=Aethina tumida TaxID=116153 RepID=UPI0021480FA5|nr:dedicator of cytokinesis protein 1 isoform X5 [Aethina tumida]